jgi:hypothetical protein
MIKYENNMLVLDSSHTKQDQEAVNLFIEKATKDSFMEGFKAGQAESKDANPR